MSIRKTGLFAVLWLWVFSVPATVLLEDDFEYEVNRNTANSGTIFTTTGPWDLVKTYQNTGQTGARAYLYTTTSIPGFSGPFPGTNSSRVLAMDLLPATLGGQTDVYLGFGNSSSSQNNVPGNVWFQYWIYINRYGDQMSQITEGKLLYPSVTGDYPASLDSELHWLYKTKNNSMPPYWESAGTGEMYIQVDCFNSCDNTGEANEDQWKMGHNITPEGGLLEPNQWYLIKVHFDTTGGDSRSIGNSVYEMWIDNIKVAEWIGGVTPNFTWTSPGTSGHKAFRIPTTINDVDQWIYIDDFVMATDEASLPTYGSDTDPPTLSSLGPSGTHAQATASINLVVTTDEIATCRYSHGAATTWANMTEFAITGSTSHSQSVATWPGLVRQSCYKCQDSSLNESDASCTTYWVEPEPKQPVRH